MLKTILYYWITINDSLMCKYANLTTFYTVGDLNL